MSHHGPSNRTIRKALTLLCRPVETTAAGRITLVEAADTAVLALRGAAGAFAAGFDACSFVHAVAGGSGDERG